MRTCRQARTTHNTYLFSPLHLLPAFHLRAVHVGIESLESETVVYHHYHAVAGIAIGIAPCNPDHAVASGVDGGTHSRRQVYARMLTACGRKGDVLFAISTSGNSSNVLNAIGVAKLNDITTVGFTGDTGGRMASLCDVLINVPSASTPRIQEAHILLGHIICEAIEKRMFG